MSSDPGSEGRVLGYWGHLNQQFFFPFFRFARLGVHQQVFCVFVPFCLAWCFFFFTRPGSSITPARRLDSWLVGWLVGWSVGWSVGWLPQHPLLLGVRAA